MNAFHLSFRTDNDAFHEGTPDQEIARILREAAARIETRSMHPGTRYLIHDANGNHVGSFNAET